MNLPDPCGDDAEYELLAAIYIKFLQFGVNYTNKDGLRAQTLGGYRHRHFEPLQISRISNPH